MFPQRACPLPWNWQKKYGTPYVTGTPIGRRTALRLAGLLRLGAGTGKNQSLFGGEASGEGVSGLHHAGPCIPGLPDDLSRERVLIVGEQVIAGSLRCSLREDLGARDVTVLCPVEGSESMAEEGDMLVWDEDEAISRIGRSTVVIAEPPLPPGMPQG